MAQLDDPKAIAARGEEIYRIRYKAELESRHRGKFVAVDVNTEAAYVGDTVEAALGAARQAAPDGAFHLIKIGEPAAFRVSRSGNAELGGVLS